jgi:hypothetical protein
MREARLPGFITEPRGDTRHTSHYAGASAPALQLPEEGTLVAQQECFTTSGRCTGFWPWYQGTQCVTGISGYQTCCTAASTYPNVRECQNPDGSWRVVNEWCGYCWW